MLTRTLYSKEELCAEEGFVVRTRLLPEGIDRYFCRINNRWHRKLKGDYFYYPTDYTDNEIFIIYPYVYLYEVSDD